MDETHPRNPVNPYGKTKLAIEHALEDYSHAYGLKYVSLRYFNAAGALPEHGLGEQHSPETHVIPLMFTAMQEQKPFKIFGNDYDTKDGTCVRDYIHVHDIARAHVKALDHITSTGTSDCFNLGSGVGYTVNELVQVVEKVCGGKLLIQPSPRRGGDAPVLVADARKAASILEWTPQCSDLEFIVKSALRWEEVRYQQPPSIAEHPPIVS